MPENALPQESSQMMNVLWITNVANPYRIPAWRALAEQVNLTMALLARSEPNRSWNISEEQIGLKTVFIDAPVFRSGVLSMYWPNRRLHKLLKQDLDAVILGGWESPAYLYSLWIAKRRGLKTVSHYGSTNKSHTKNTGLPTRVRSWFYRSLDAHVTYGTEATKSLLAMQVQASRIVTGFNSVDHDYFHTAVNHVRVSNLDHERQGHSFLFVGRLIPLKNIDSVIRAFSLMHTEVDSLRIVGSGPEEKQLRELISELGLVDKVVIAGPKSGESLLEEYARANTLVLASTNEVWGLVVNEALASGLRVVVSENCGVASDVIGMEGVYLCDTSVASIEKAMSYSSQTGNEPIATPLIIQHGPKALGDYLSQAVS